MTWLRLHLLAVFHAFRVRRDLGRESRLTPASVSVTGTCPVSRRVVDLALLASRRAVARLCPVDSCLTRSLVLCRLLAPYSGVELHYGFRRREGTLEGHAWVTVDGAAVGEPDGALEGYAETDVPPSRAAFG